MVYQGEKRELYEFRSNFFALRVIWGDPLRNIRKFILQNHLIVLDKKIFKVNYVMLVYNTTNSSWQIHFQSFSKEKE